MNWKPLIVAAVALICLYVIGRRWIVAHIYAILVAAEMASPQRAKWLTEIVEKRKAVEGQEDGKEYEQLNDEIAAMDPMCAYGRQQQCLLETAWEIYSECRWRKRRRP